MEAAAKAAGAYGTSFLYRGQPNSGDGLKTTLERATESKGSVFTIGAYHIYALNAVAVLESVLEKKWNVPSYSDFEKCVIEYKDRGRYFCHHNNSYYTYLRHHGYPSPLLDWTLSPYVAAFFALRNPPSDAKAVAVYVYASYDFLGNEKIDREKTNIFTIGPYVTTHARHFRQQSCYTFCVQKDPNTPDDDSMLVEYVRYVNHEKSAANDNPSRLIKLVIPTELRQNFMHELDRMNINPYSLFGTEDSLVETMAIRRFILD